jgi:long-chain acyl-CoA synthetase
MVQRPWLEHYDLGVPTTLEPYPELTLVDYLSATARDEPAHPVLLYKGGAMSAARLERSSNAFAAALVEMGVERGDRVALLLPNCPQFLVAEFGAWKAGAILAPLDPSYTADELRELLTSIAPKVLVTLSSLHARAKEAQKQVGIPHLIVTNIKEHLPRGTRLMFTLFQEARGGHRVRLANGDRWMPDLLEVYRGAFRPSLTISADDEATLLATGGTTGMPKLVLGSHGNAVASGFQLSAWFRELAEPGRDVVMLSIPLFHVYGSSLVQGLSIMARLPLALVPDPRDVTEALTTLHRTRPAFIAGVPSVFAALAEHPLVLAGRIDFSSLKMCFSGVAPLLAETRGRFEALAGCPIVQGYGLTESQSVNVVNPVNGVHKIGSVGMPLPDTTVRIRDRDGSHDVPIGEVGEIWLRCPQLMRGYWRDEPGTAAALRTEGGERWIRTGDLGYLDADGYLFIVDRLKDLIDVGGFQVWPREIEEVIATHPGVAEVGVAAVPDDRRGAVARAWVVAAPEQVLVEDDIRAHCARHLASYKIPTLVTFCDSLPKTAFGKVQRRRLVERHIAEARTAAGMRASAFGDRSVILPAHAEGLSGGDRLAANRESERRPRA